MGQALVTMGQAMNKAKRGAESFGSNHTRPARRLPAEEACAIRGARHRRKGNRLEREIVERHTALGIKAERYPLSGASRFRGSGHDVDIYTFGNDAAPMVTEVKGRKNGAGFVTLEKWLGEYDGLFLRRNNADPLAVCGKT